MNKSSKWDSIKDAFNTLSPLQNHDNYRKKSKKTPPARKLIPIVTTVCENEEPSKRKIHSSPIPKNPKRTSVNLIPLSDDENSIGHYDPDQNNISSCRGCFTDTSNSIQNFAIISTGCRQDNLPKNNLPTSPITSTSTFKRNAWTSSISNTFKSRQEEIKELDNSILDEDSNDIPINVVKSSSSFIIDDSSESSQATNTFAVGQTKNSPTISNNTNASINSCSSPDCDAAILPTNFGASPIEKRRRKPAKGSQEEKFQKCLNKSKSNFAFWQHERRSNLISQGECVTIEKIEISYGRSLVYGLAANGDKIVYCLDPNSKLVRRLKEGQTLEIQFDSNGYLLDDTLIAYPFLEKVLLKS